MKIGKETSIQAAYHARQTNKWLKCSDGRRFTKFGSFAQESCIISDSGRRYGGSHDLVDTQGEVGLTKTHKPVPS